MTDPRTVADDLETQVNVHDLPTGEPEAGFAPGHHADVRQGVRNGDFSEPPPYPDLPINDLTNKLPGWSTDDIGTSGDTYWIADSNGAGHVESTLTGAIAGEQAGLRHDGEFVSAPVAAVIGRLALVEFAGGDSDPDLIVLHSALYFNDSGAVIAGGVSSGSAGVPAASPVVRRLDAGAIPATARRLRVGIAASATGPVAGPATVAFYGVRILQTAIVVAVIDQADPGGLYRTGLIEQSGGSLSITALTGAGHYARLILGPDGVGGSALQNALGGIFLDASGEVRITPATDTHVTSLLRGTGGVATKAKAGAPVDGDFSMVPEDGTLAVNTSTGQIYYRSGGSWIPAAAASALSGYQPLDSDLTDIAALTPTNDDVLQRKASHWVNRTIAQLLVDLAAPGTTFQPLDSDLTAIAALSTTAYGRAFLALVDAAAARTALALGTAAVLASDTDTLLVANSDLRLATQKAVKAYVDAAVVGLLDFKGNTDASANPNYPAASKGDAYAVSVAGKVGGASGKSVDVGDVYVASADNAGGTEASVGTSWFVLEHNLTGALLAANNLSDLASAATARTNLGLGALATLATVGSGQIDAAAVTPAKMADLAQDQFIGRTTASTGVPQTATITAAARTVLDDTTVAAMLATLAGVSLAPTATQSIVSTGGTGVTPLVLKGAASQAANLFEIRTSADVVGVSYSTGPADAGLAGLTVNSTALQVHSFAAYANDATSVQFLVFKKSRNATVGSHTVVASGDTIGSINWQGSDGAAYRNAAIIRAEVDGTPGASDMPGRLLFLTTPDGSITAAERLRIDSAGAITISEGGNVILGTTTGTKIGTATSQKLGFFNATPIIQPAAAAQAAAPTGGTGTAAGGWDTAANRDAAIATINAIRTALVNLGLMKGAA